MTGQEEVEDTIRKIEEQEGRILSSHQLEVLPLYAGLPADQQRLVSSLSLSLKYTLCNPRIN